MPGDFQKFANLRFLRTVDWAVLGRLLGRHAEGLDGLDLGLLASDPPAGREAVSDFLRGPKDRYPELLVVDLHRIARMDKPIAMQILLNEAARRGVSLRPRATRARATARNLALLAFVDHPEIFAEAENAVAFLPPRSVSEFNATGEGVAADLTPEVLEAFRARAAALFAADLRGDFCRIIDYEDDGEVHIAVRHGAPPVTTEVVKRGGNGLLSFQEIDTAVLAYSAIAGRLTVWGCARKRRPDLAEAFADAVLGRPRLFKAADAQRLYTLEPVERSGGAFAFRRGADGEIDRILVVEAQANRVATNPRTGKERTLFSLTARDPEGAALRLLHASRADIVYGDNAWRLAHIAIRILLKSAGARAPTITVKIKPPDSVGFPRHRHRRRVTELIRLNNLLHAREPAGAAVAAE
jgi:hypothetical protein